MELDELEFVKSKKTLDRDDLVWMGLVEWTASIVGCRQSIDRNNYHDNYLEIRYEDLVHSDRKHSINTITKLFEFTLCSTFEVSSSSSSSSERNANANVESQYSMVQKALTIVKPFQSKNTSFISKDTAHNVSSITQALLSDCLSSKPFAFHHNHSQTETQQSRAIDNPGSEDIITQVDHSSAQITDLETFETIAVVCTSHVSYKKNSKLSSTRKKKGLSKDERIIDNFS
ncbi:hypothetical protein RFI_09332 [Reticulomyxa filosa]|uniref:Uncharacterized protein n=1 Tax=Reticulomyxa filosa TaxID=46433 RepID=X6NND3_RETFI|nr:hypothetical protein RFI_09332 [Reticulomyxa filosa]|eukprot:ETO27800.1 hypothetical protein RFI_09332 [Reticulomyxa filosa]